MRVGEWPGRLASWLSYLRFYIWRQELWRGPEKGGETGHVCISSKSTALGGPNWPSEGTTTGSILVCHTGPSQSFPKPHALSVRTAIINVTPYGYHKTTDCENYLAVVSSWFPSRSVEQGPYEQVFLNKTIEQKNDWTNPTWPKYYWTRGQLNKWSVEHQKFERWIT